MCYEGPPILAQFFTSPFSYSLFGQKVPVYVSVHVRRTDYKLWMSVLAKGYLASKAFYSSAMGWFRNKYNAGDKVPML